MAVNAQIRTLATDFRLYSHQLQFLVGEAGLTNQILAAIGEEDWDAKRLMSVDSARAVVGVGPRDDSRTTAVLKISRNSDAAAIMERERGAIAAVLADSRLSELRPILPREIAWGRIGNRAFSVETALTGVDSRTLMRDEARSARALAAAIEVASVLHTRTARTVAVDARAAQRWIDEPLRRVSMLERAYPRIRRHRGTISRLAKSLTAAVGGRRMTLSWVHGDLFPGNVLVEPDGGTVTGLVDWDLAAPDDIPALDIVHLLLATHLLRTRTELGQTVIRLLAGEPITVDVDEILGAAQARLDGEPLSLREAVVLEWLRHIGSNLTKSAHFERHRRWVRANIENVLDFAAERDDLQ